MARSDTPQYAALRQAPASSGSDISSIAMSSGDMQRRRIMAARAFRAVRQHIRPLSDIKSAAAGRQRCDLSALVAKTDAHSPSESVRTISRSSVVSPPGGREDQCEETDVRRISSRSLYLSRNTDTHGKRSSRFQRPRSPPGNRPQNPTRTPPSAVMKLRRKQSDAA